MKLTANDQRVLDAVARACGEWDGFAPHGPADWTGIRRLVGAGLVKMNGDGVCQSCDVGHDTWSYVLTETRP